MENEEKKVVDLSKLSPKEELEKMAEICAKLNRLYDDKGQSSNVRSDNQVDDDFNSEDKETTKESLKKL